MSAQRRRDQLHAWMRLRPPYRIGTIFRLVPGELYDTLWKLRRDLKALKAEDRITQTSTRRWTVVREAA